jgi:hypothetical protein
MPDDGRASLVLGIVVLALFMIFLLLPSPDVLPPFDVSHLPELLGIIFFVLVVTLLMISPFLLVLFIGDR